MSVLDIMLLVSFWLVIGYVVLYIFGAIWFYIFDGGDPFNPLYGYYRKWDYEKGTFHYEKKGK